MFCEPAPFACNPENSRGRVHDEPGCRSRSDYQRDRDRIIHSRAFRRLKHKTQVFAAPEGDHYRTRLTHSLEVAQIARSLARSLRIDEDLTEALALAHDLGHPPFGHAGERALSSCMTDYGGFDHNLQCLRLITSLERRYAGFDGLNLTYETLEGIVKHNGPLQENIKELEGYIQLKLELFPPLEAQIASLADDIAYNAHDIDDGVRAGLISLEQLKDAPLAGAAMIEVMDRWPGLEPARLVHETVRLLISLMVEDLLAGTQKHLEACKPGSPDDIRRYGRAMAAFSPKVKSELDQLGKFLLHHMYRHKQISSVMGKAEMIVERLFRYYLENQEDIPDGDDKSLPARRVCDFIAGMTDQFAIRQYEHVFDESLDFG